MHEGGPRETTIQLIVSNVKLPNDRKQGRAIHVLGATLFAWALHLHLDHDLAWSKTCRLPLDCTGR
jgi:hypothetical protein